MKNRSCIIAVFVLFSLILFANSSRAKDIPKVSMGLGASAGYYSAYSEYKGGQDYTYTGGPGYGAGLVFERMLSERFGIHSGLWYTMASIGIEMEFIESSGLMKVDGDLNLTMFTLPVYLMTSIKKGRFSINFLSGLQLSYIKSSELAGEVKSGTDQEDLDMDMIAETNFTQIGLGLGFEFKIGISKFIDIFIITVGEYYLSPLMDEFGPVESSTEDYLYDVKIQSGVLFRTF